MRTPSHSVATHDASTQLPLTEFFIGCILSNDPLDRQACHWHIAMLGAPHRHNPLTLLRFAAPAAPAMPATVTSTIRPTCVTTAVCRSREVCPSVRLTWYTCSSGTGATSQSRPPTATCQYHPSGNTSCALSYYLQEKCKYCPCGNPQSCWCRSSCKNWSFS